MEKSVRHRRRVKTALFWLFLLGGFAVFALSTTLPKYYQNRELSGKIERLQRDNQELEESIERAQTNLEAFQNDPFFSEVIAREELRMRRPGERTIKVPAPFTARTLTPGPPYTSVRTLNPIIRKVLFDRRMQTFFLAIAYILIATAFLFFNEPEHKSPELPRKAYG
jgi:cell division protein FtsB